LRVDKYLQEIKLPNILLITLNHNDAAKLEQLARKKNFRLSTAFELTQARELLKKRSFDVVFLDREISVRVQERLATLLWQKNPLAPFVLYSLDEKSQIDEREARLAGADIAWGSGVLEKLEKILGSLKPAGSVKPEDFSIMVVEDLDSPRDIICFFIESLGYTHVIGKSSVKEALEDLEQQPEKYSCVVTDLKMPVLNGQELIRTIRSTDNLKHIPIITLTAHGTVDNLIESLRNGTSGFLIKPPKKNDLTRELSRAMRIITSGRNPRLTNEEEAELLRDLLIQKGMAD